MRNPLQLTTPPNDQAYALDKVLRLDGLGQPWPLDARWVCITWPTGAPALESLLSVGQAMAICTCEFAQVVAGPESEEPTTLKNPAILLRVIRLGGGFRRPTFAGRCPRCKTVYWGYL